MMKRLLLWLLVLGTGLGGATIARGGTIDNLTFTLSNNGVISGNPGTAPGWGFSLTNTMNYVVIAASEFDITQNAGDGSYTDIIGPDFIVVGTGQYASTPISQVFDANVPTGVGSFAISPSATIGDQVLGTITLTYDVYSVSPNDPSFDPIVDTLANGLQTSASAQVNVTATPEPGSLLLLLTATGLGLVLLPRLGRAGA